MYFMTFLIAKLCVDLIRITNTPLNRIKLRKLNWIEIKHLFF